MTAVVTPSVTSETSDLRKRDLDSAAGDRLAEAFYTEERASLRLLMYVRFAVSAAIIIFIMSNFPNVGGLYWSVLTAVFGLLGVLQYRIAISRHHAQWHKYVWIFLDIGLVSFIILGGNPGLEEQFPLSERLRYPNFDYLYLVAAVLALSYTPRAVVWIGISAVICWGIGVIWIISQPEIHTEFTYPNFRQLPATERTEVSNSRFFVNISARIQEFFIMLTFAGVLAAAGWRARRLVYRQVTAERARANLSRYFSPAIVDEILKSDVSVSAGRTQKAAVLFADIVGFTRMAEQMTSAEVMTLLREFHRRMGGAIFDNHGTIDKYIGDEVMATFGTPLAGPDDAANAIACAATIRVAVAAWNRERAAEGQPPVDVGVGVHYGDVILGNMGDERRLEFAVIGDTVNVAARLQALTRDRDESVLISGDAVDAAGTPANVTRNGAAPVRGRTGEVSLWTLA